jgi:7,8-dihydropterin-6-yl-methyl-4-(beta-D-ribofuranosyl)aminobenzene 5'-phosphate synthase
MIYTPMLVDIIFNNENLNQNFIPGWGFSALINRKILFDTGEKFDYLVHNAKNMGIDIEAIEVIIISHNHWDHTGGLWQLLQNNNKRKVYCCSDFSPEFKQRVNKLGPELIEVNTPIAITPYLFTSGQMVATYHQQPLYEQALILKLKDGIGVITGCAHPGIVKILKEIKRQFPGDDIIFVWGGFHLMNKENRQIEVIAQEIKKMGVKKIGPTHCSGFQAQNIFKRLYKDNFISIKGGESFEV